MRGRIGLVVIVVLGGSAVAVDRAAADRVLDRPAFTATPAELLAAARAVPDGDHSRAILRHERDTSFDAQGRATLREHEIYIVRAPHAAGSDGDDDDDDDRPDDGALVPVVANWRPSSQDRPAIRARVIAPAGSVAELDPAQVEDPYPSAGSGPVLDQRFLSAKLPHGEPGSVVEWEVITRDREPALAGATVREYLPMGSPLTVTVSVPAGQRLRRVERNLPPGVQVRHSVAGGRERWTYDLPPRGEMAPFEPGAPADEASRAYLGATTAASWTAVARAYRAVIDRRIADGPVVLPSALPHAPSRAAIDAIMAWLRDRLHAGPADFATAPYVPSPPATVLTRGASGITDHATLLVAVLRQAGIRADLVLLDTGPGTDVDPDLPGLSQFDHVIVRARLATGDVWIDPTETLVAPGQLPPRVQGRRGLVIASDTKGLIAIPAAAPGDNAIREVRTFAAAERGRASLTVVTRATGALESQLRVAFSTRPRLPKKSAVEDPDLARYGGAVTSASSTTVGDVATPFVVTREIASTQRVRCQGEYVDIDLPSGDVLVEIPWTARYQSKTVRTRDYVWTTPVIHEIENRIDLPPGFAPPEPPPERVVHLGPATFRELRRVEGQTLIVALRFESGKLRWTAAELRSMQQALPALEKQPIRIEVESTAHALLEAGKLREAAAEDARLIALHPREALHHEQLAVLLIRAGLGDAARREARAAAALEPTNATTLTQLAWVLVHDRLGRGSRFDWDRAGALEALHKARALAPDHPGAAYHLALVQERGASGALFAPDADLRSAVEAWTAARDTEHDDATTLHLAHTLLWAGQPIAAETLARTTKPDAQRDATIVAAIAEAQGAAAAIAEAGKLRSGDERTRLIQQVMWEERDRRRYDLSRAMFAEIRSANQVAAFWAAAIAHLSSHPDVAPGSSDPRTALADLFRAMPDPARKTPVFWDARVEADLRGDAHRSMPPPSERAGAQRLLSDVLQSANYRIEGGDGVWRAHGDGEWAPKLVIYLVLDRGVVKVVGASDHTSGIGRYVLGLDLHDGAAAGRARRLLDFVRGDLEAATAHIPTLFKRMWGRGQPTTNDAMQVAAAVLANETDADRALAVVQRCAPRSADAQYACHAVRALLLRQRERWVDAVTEYQAAVALEPGELAFALVPYTRALAALGRRADADRLVDGFVAAHPDDGVGLLVRYELALEAGDAAEATRRLDALERAPNTTSWQLNRAAWEQLGRGGDLARGLELARKAVDMAKLAHAERNTLAMLEAETGDLDAAARDSREAMLHGNSDQPEDSDWCVAARIAEQLGQTGDAIAIYRRIAKPGDARFSLAGYAAQRLAALQRSP